VRAIRESLLDVLEVARLAVKADVAMLFVLNDEGDRLKLKECVATGRKRSIIERPISASEGALGAVVKTRRSVNLMPREGGRHLGYTTKDEVGSLLAVPVLEAGHIAGVLAVDRQESDPFTEHDEGLLDAVAREAQRAMESERIFVSMDSMKR
jgi:signal transduction protein with GAF and PtsI domain